MKENPTLLESFVIYLDELIAPKFRFAKYLTEFDYSEPLPNIQGNKCILIDRYWFEYNDAFDHYASHEFSCPLAISRSIRDFYFSIHIEKKLLGKIAGIAEISNYDA